MNGIKMIALGGLLAAPALAQAQDVSQLEELVEGLLDVAQQLLPLVVTLALLFFFWGILKFIIGISQGKSPSEAGGAVLFWGIVALFVIVSIWGIIQFIQNTLGVEGGGEIEVPEIEGQLDT